MVTLKLARVGKKKQPTFRLVVTEKGSDPWGHNLEILGWKNPRTKETKFEVERIKYWLSKGAQMTATVNNLLIDQKIITGEKRRNITISNTRKAKIEAEKPKAEAPAAEAAPAETPAAA